MAYKTFGELKTKLEKEIDIEEEEFVQPEELVGYFDSAVSIVEAEIIKLGLRERYLTTESYISTVSGTADYSLPTDIIDSKIRKVTYIDGNLIYTVKPITGEEQFEAEDILNLNSASQYHRYKLIKIGEDPTFRLVPKAGKTVTNALHMRYEKDLNRYDDDDTSCDVPTICYEFILSYVRYRVYLKETHANVPAESATLKDMLQLMRETLQGQVNDPDMDVIDQDLSAYEEMS